MAFTEYQMEKEITFLGIFSDLAKDLDWLRIGRAIYDLGEMLFVCHIAKMAGRTTIKAKRNYWTEKQAGTEQNKNITVSSARYSMTADGIYKIDVEQFSDLMCGLTIDSYIRNRKHPLKLTDFSVKTRL